MMPKRVGSSGVRISVEPNADRKDLDTVGNGLLAFNVEFIGPPREEAVNILLRDAEERVVGGLLGTLRWRWLYVAKLWVAAPYRGQGFGAALMHAAEQLAVERQCLGMYLDTFEYQARPFYEKLGYELFGTLEGFPPGYRQFFLSKRLTADRDVDPR
jgi:GNAT superfamily N-acetyltransferase